MDKLIFLDIDGVVNTYQIDIKPFKKGQKPLEDGFYADLCCHSDGRVSNRQAIMWLNKLCKDTGAKIVISSTWRFCEKEGEPTTEDCLRNTGLLPEIEIVGKTPIINNASRGNEIQAFLDEYLYSIESFVILDDDADMGILTDHLVKCDVYRGFEFPEYIKALEILKK